MYFIATVSSQILRNFGHINQTYFIIQTILFFNLKIIFFNNVICADFKIVFFRWIVCLRRNFLAELFVEICRLTVTCVCFQVSITLLFKSGKFPNESYFEKQFSYEALRQILVSSQFHFYILYSNQVFTQFTVF